MENLSIFSEEKELRRLATQNELMHACEAPIFRELFAGKHGLNVLDVGSNNGEKTVRWFSGPAVARVLGLEYNAALAQRAQKEHGGERFRFRPCDVETDDFGERLAAWMAEDGTDGFDIIYLSFVLSHLKAPERLLTLLRPLLRPGGSLVAVETDDASAALLPEDRRFGEFLDILSQDPYAGDRGTGGRLPEMLGACGFREPVVRCNAISAGPDETEKKAMIYEMFFSYLPEDIAALRQKSPEDERYARWEQWIGECRAPLYRAICAPASRISMGMSVVTCKAGLERS